MKPPTFRYVRPESLDEAIDVLAKYGDEAKVLAGGQSLVPVLNLRLARPGVLVDINNIPGLDRITANGDLVVGATVRQVALERSREVGSHVPVLCSALKYVGHPAIRTRGTLAGSAAHADGASELPAVLMAVDAKLVARGPQGERTIAAEDFFVTHFTTALEPDEILTEVRIPPSPASLPGVVLEVTRRHGDFALVGAVALGDVDQNGLCRSPRLVLFGVSDRPLRLHEAEDVLTGCTLNDAEAVYEEITDIIGRTLVEARSDFHATPSYRREVAGVLARRAFLMLAAKGEN